MPHKYAGAKFTLFDATQSKQFLSKGMLASLPAEKQKPAIGNHLYPLIEQQVQDDADDAELTTVKAQIMTGMLLTLDNILLLEMIANPDVLQRQVDELRSRAGHRP